MSWIDLEDTKSYLSIDTPDSNGRDAKLQIFINGSCGQIEAAIGHVDIAAVTEDLEVNRDGKVILSERPVHSIASVSKLNGDGTSTVIPRKDALAGVAGWEIESAGGVVSVPCFGTVRVVCSVGLDPVPDNYELAAYTLVEHHWKQSQFNATGGRAQRTDASQMVMPGFKNALPYRVRELLGLFGQEVRSEVFVG